MRMKLIALVSIILLLTSCSSNGNEEQKASTGEETQQQESKETTTDYVFKSCSNGVIDYFDMIMWNDISYFYAGEKDSNSSQGNAKIRKGKELGEIGYTLADSACLGYRMQPTCQWGQKFMK